MKSKQESFNWSKNLVNLANPVNPVPVVVFRVRNS